MVFSGIKTRSGKTATSLVLVLSIILVVFSGVTYRVLASRLKAVVDAPIELLVPLSAFPLQVDSWVGKDVPIPLTTQRVAGNDDFLNRLYINEQKNQWANLYIAYSARPRTMMGHRPDICYVGAGWVLDETKFTEFMTSSGIRIPCLIFFFHRPSPSSDTIVILNYYILNGRIMADDKAFITGLGWRTPNIEGNRARYVTQVQISSVLENSVFTVAKAFTDEILDYFPDEDGTVRTSENK